MKENQERFLIEAFHRVFGQDLPPAPDVLPRSEGYLFRYIMKGAGPDGGGTTKKK